MRNGYPIDQAAQAKGEAAFLSLTDSKDTLHSLDDGIDEAYDKIQDLKSVFERNDVEIEGLLSDIYDSNIKY